MNLFRKMSASVNPEAGVGYGMKMALATMNLRFPKVQHLPTSVLGKWMESPSEDIIVILVTYDVVHISSS